MKNVEQNASAQMTERQIANALRHLALIHRQKVQMNHKLTDFIERLSA